MDRPTWDELFIAIAVLGSSRGTCNRLRTSCVLVKNNRIIGSGYNGAVSGLTNCDDEGHLMVDGHCLRTLHGEDNAIANAVSSLEGATAYIIATPCLGCVKKLLQYGVSRIVYVGDYQNASGKEYIAEICKEKGAYLECWSSESGNVAAIFKKIFNRLQGPGGIFKNLVLPEILFGPHHANIRLMDGGKLIIFEGIDGCGKSTQIKKLGRYLIQKGYKVLVTHEPGGGLAHIRDMLLNLKEEGEENLAMRELGLFEEDRKAHYIYKILPALACGKVVISDRGPLSTLAYQGYGRGLDLALIEKANYKAIVGREADLTIFMDINVDDALERFQKNGSKMLDRFEKKEFLEKVKMGYLEEALKQVKYGKWQTVWADAPEDIVFHDVKTAVEERLEL
jgi:dTMP kinase